MNILLTGVTGFIGKHLVLGLKKQGYKLFCVTRKTSDTSFLEKNKIDYLKYFGNDDELKNYIKNNDIIGVVHLATLYLISNGLEDIENLINSNITFGTKLLEISSGLKVKWFLNTSSFIQNYEGKKYSPQNLYASTKQAFEDIGSYYGESNKINFISLSLVNTYGPGDTRKKILNIWKDLIDDSISVDFTSGEQYIDILYIDDVIDAYKILIKQINVDGGNKFNNKKIVVSSENIIKLKELASIFEDVVGKKLKINWGYLEHRKREIMYPHNIGETISGWTPKIGIREGIKRFIIY